MDLNSKVSIIIPVYNGSNYLKEAIDSALNQTYKNIEVIVINDGSNDNGKTKEIAKSYGDKIRYFYKKNGGVSTALNLGIKNMTGEWFSWLSHDDIYMPDKIKKQLSYIKKDPKIKIINSGFCSFNKEKKWKVEQVVDRNLIKNGRDFFEVNGLNGCALLIHKECFNKVGLFNESNKTVQDWEMWINIIKYYPVHCTKDIVLKQRIHGEMGTFTMTDQHEFDKIKFFKTIFKKFDHSFFMPEDQKNINSSKKYAQSYQWLAKKTLSNKSIGGAFIIYEKAYKTYPSPLNISFYIHFIGEKKFKKIISIYFKTSKKIYDSKIYIIEIIKKYLPGIVKIYKKIKTTIT